MAPRPTWKPRKTIIELYTERDATKWYWRALGMLSASMMLIGFLVFPISFQTAVTAPSPGASSVVAVILLALGYSLSVALWFICTSWLFQLDVLFIPCLFSCVLGLINTAISLANGPAGAWTTPSIAALSLACASSLIYAFLSLLTYRRISMIRAHNDSHRTDSESTTLLPEDELQRQQLLRLLLQKESDKTSPQTSQSTFRIDLPDTIKAQREANPQDTIMAPISQPSMHLTAPSHIYESRGRSISALPIDDQFALLRGQVVEPAIDRKQAALEQARARSQHNNSHASNYTTTTTNLSRGPSGNSHTHPPVIVNTRSLDGTQLPISELHPLERAGGFIRGEAPHHKDGYAAEGVYRPEDHEPPSHVSGQEEDDAVNFSYSNPSPERARAEIELEDRGRRQAEMDGGGLGAVRTRWR